MADQHPYGYEERFKFTGKERDSETGYDYFGARFYASLFGFWLSVDPLSDKYPNISPYAYCNWNPIKFVDPDGRKVAINGTYINEDVLSFASAVVNLRATTQWNPFYWYGAKNQIYTRSQIHMRGGYANSFKQAGLRLKKSPLGKIGGFLGVINMGNIIYDMGKNGISAGNTVDLAMNLVGYYGPWGLLASAIYGVADWGVTTISGQSNSDWINYGVNYLIEEY